MKFMSIKSNLSENKFYWRKSKLENTCAVHNAGLTQKYTVKIHYTGWIQIIKTIKQNKLIKIKTMLLILQEHRIVLKIFNNIF